MGTSGSPVRHGAGWCRSAHAPTGCPGPARAGPHRRRGPAPAPAPMVPDAAEVRGAARPRGPGSSMFHVKRSAFRPSRLTFHVKHRCPGHRRSVSAFPAASPKGPSSQPAAQGNRFRGRPPGARRWQVRPSRSHRFRVGQQDNRPIKPHEPRTCQTHTPRMSRPVDKDPVLRTVPVDELADNSLSAQPSVVWRSADAWVSEPDDPAARSVRPPRPQGPR